MRFKLILRRDEILPRSPLLGLVVLMVVLLFSHTINTHLLRPPLCSGLLVVEEEVRRENTLRTHRDTH